MELLHSSALLHTQYRPQTNSLAPGRLDARRADHNNVVRASTRLAVAAHADVALRHLVPVDLETCGGAAEVKVLPLKAAKRKRDASAPCAMLVSVWIAAAWCLSTKSAATQPGRVEARLSYST